MPGVQTGYSARNNYMKKHDEKLVTNTDVQRLKEFMQTLDITKVIRGLDADGLVDSPLPCECGEVTVRVDTNWTYQCVSCGDRGHAPQYLIEREGFDATDAVIEVTRRANYPHPFITFH